MRSTCVLRFVGISLQMKGSDLSPLMKMKSLPTSRQKVSINVWNTMCAGVINEVHTLFKIPGLRRVGPLSGRFDGHAPGLAFGFGLRRRLLLDSAAARPRRLARRSATGALTGPA